MEDVGPNVEAFSVGDEVFYSGNPIRHGSNAEFQLVAAGSVARKPKSLDFVEAAAMPLTYITAYEALVERMEIKKGEKAALLIINGSGGVFASFITTFHFPSHNTQVGSVTAYWHLPFPFCSILSSSC